MGCSGCSSRGIPAGCKSNGNCASGSCTKLNVFNWLNNMSLPVGTQKFEGVEVRFKNDRKSFFRNSENLDLIPGDVVVTEAGPGHDVGVVSCMAELARIQMNKKAGHTKTHELKKIYRKARQNDLDRWKEARSREYETMHRAREMALQHNLIMKISDVEYQGDGNKAIFYYTAEDRVDFRQLIRTMAESFKVRIEMKQIGARQESGKLGGIGSCGRELCCSTWLTDFRSVSTSAARYQQLSINPQKLAGQCGKLKCCLNYELDQYIEAFKQFPSSETHLETEKGIAYWQKTDIFKGVMWYAYSDPKLSGSHIPLKIDRVKEIINQNKNGKKPRELEEFIETVIDTTPKDYTNVVGQDSLNRFDQLNKKKKQSKSSNKRSKSKNQRKSANKINNKQQRQKK